MKGYWDALGRFHVAEGNARVAAFGRPQPRRVTAVYCPHGLLKWFGPPCQECLAAAKREATRWKRPK